MTIYVATSTSSRTVATFRMTTAEKWVLACDFSNVLSSGEAISSATCTITESLSDAIIPDALATGAPTVSTAGVVTAPAVLGAGLKKDRIYYLNFNARIADTKQVAPRLQIKVE